MCLLLSHQGVVRYLSGVASGSTSNLDKKAPRCLSGIQSKMGVVKKKNQIFSKIFNSLFYKSLQDFCLRKILDFSNQTRRFA